MSQALSQPAPDSLWLEEAAAELPNWSRPEPGSHRETETLVVGAGLCGSSLAWELNERGRDVLVVDALGPGRGASGRNAGFVLVSNAVEWVELRDRLQARAGAEGIPGFLGLARRNHQIIAERHAEAAEHRRLGSSMLCVEDDHRERQALEASAKALQADGVACDFVEVQPSLRGLSKELWIPEDGEVHPAKLVASIAQELPGLRATVQSFQREEGPSGGVLVQLSNEATVLAQRVVMCTNAWAALLSPVFRGSIVPGRAQVLATAPIQERLVKRPCYAGWGYDYFRQRADGRVILGGRRHLFREQETVYEARPSELVQKALDEYLTQVIPGTIGAAIESRWAGIMGLTQSELPCIGVPEGQPDARVLIAAGFSGHGLGLSLATAEHLAEGLAKASSGTAAPAFSNTFAALFAPTPG